MCTAGTAAEFNLVAVMAARGIGYSPVVVDTNDEIVTVCRAGRCDATTTDKQGLVGRRGGLPDAATRIVLDETLSKGPLGPWSATGTTSSSGWSTPPSRPRNRV